jgi:hypothetical protein
MFKRSALIGLALCCIVQPASAGYYSSIDTPEETRWSRDFAGVFYPEVLTKLRSIRVDKLQGTDYPMRNRYIIFEAMANDGNVKLHTLEAQLNYSTVLIRRGKADEAVALLKPVAERGEHANHFLALSHYATALFLSANADFKINAREYMKQALENWPEKWSDIKGEQLALLKKFGWEETAFDRYRRYETHFKRLIDHRLAEDRRRAKKQQVPDTLDPVFVDDKKKPLTFLAESGKFEAGRIVEAEFKSLPRDSVEMVEQFLIWMPDDKPLLWLLGEVFNASAMEHQDPKRKNEAILNALAVFERLTNLQEPTTYGVKEAKNRFEVLEKARAAMPPPDDGIKLPAKDADVMLTNAEWWRRQAIVFALGAAIGMFALWQVQEVRRRRQARAAAHT